MDLLAWPDIHSILVHRSVPSVDLGKLSAGFHCSMMKFTGMYCPPNNQKKKTKIHIHIYISLFSSIELRVELLEQRNLVLAVPPRVIGNGGRPWGRRGTSASASASAN